jgi:hypothetical protein
MKAKINMQETLAQALQAIAKAQKQWRKREGAFDAIAECRYARAMLVRAEDALLGELEIEDK